MDFGNFHDTSFVIFFSIIILLVISLSVMTALFAISHNKDQKFLKGIKYEKNTIRISIIDVQKNKITTFTKSDIKHKKTTDLMSFYSSIHPNDVDKVKDWIFSIYMGQDVEEYLEADILLSNGRKPCFSLFKLLKFNRANGLIHIESHLLKYITPNNAPRSKHENKRLPTGVVNRSKISAMVHKNKSLRGFTFGVRFFYIKQQALSNNKIEHHMLMTLKNEVYPFTSNPKIPRQILDEGGNEVFLFDLRIAEKKEAMQLASSISHALLKQMEVNGFVGYISFAIGVVENGQYYQDFDTIMEHAREACISGQTTGQEIVLHRRNIKAQNVVAKYEDQINRLFNHDVLRYLFRPIINTKTGQTIGYFEYVKAYDSPFSNFSEMSKYAAKINKNIELFALVCKHIIPKFISENRDSDCRLFVSSSLFDIDDIVSTVTNISGSEKVKLVFIFDEQEVNENASNYHLLEEKLTYIRDSGYEMALLLKDKDLLLDNSVYHLFDYFIVGSSMIGEIRKNNRIRLSAYTLIESLLRYNRPIIASDLESWQSVELIIESGITYISTDVISPSNDMLLPIEKKKLEKVIQMTNKYS